MQTETVSREDLVARIMWNGGGCGFGLCGVAGMMAWATAKPSERCADLKSIVAVSGPPEKYTDEELRQLAAFSERVTAEYDKMFSIRMGANLICIDKREDGQWMRKRLTWEMGPMFSDTLQEAIAVFERGVT